MMRLTDHTVNLLSQALVSAANLYVEFAVDCANLRHGERVSEQFLKQAVEIRQIAILLGDGHDCAIEASYVEDNAAKSDAERITIQLFVDATKERRSRNA